MDQAEYFQNLHDYIDGLDEDIKAGLDIYTERLVICKRCERLQDAMCNACGCYVELKAAILKNTCPYKLW